MPVIRVPKDIFKALVEESRERDITVSDLVDIIVSEYLHLEEEEEDEEEEEKED